MGIGEGGNERRRWELGRVGMRGKGGVIGEGGSDRGG